MVGQLPKIYDCWLAELIAHKKGEQYHTTMEKDQNFLLPAQIITCISTQLKNFEITTNAINNTDMDIKVEESSIL